VAVRLVPIRGERVVVGFAGLVDGPLDEAGTRERALDLLRATGFLDTGSPGGPDPEHAVAAVREHLAVHPEVRR
jgi:urease subunit gamma/beta